MANQSLRLTIQTAAAAVAGIAIFAVLRSTHAIDAATASLIVAAVLGIATVLQQRQQYTVDLISAFQTEEKSRSRRYLDDQPYRQRRGGHREYQ